MIVMKVIERMLMMKVMSSSMTITKATTTEV